MFYFEDAEYFRKKDERRLMSFKRLKDHIQNRCDIIKGRTREIPISNVQVKLRDLSKTVRSNDQISNIINEVSNTHDEIVQSLTNLNREDKILNRKMRTLFKKVDDSQQMDWQSDRRYLHIKDELIKMQQDQGLPDYCKFCLINSKDTMKRMNRSNQEIKETRLLFQMRDRYPPEQLKSLAENLLKKYQRIQQNQELQRNGDGWKLITNKGNKLCSDDKVLIKEHMSKEKELSCTERIKIAQKRYKKQLQDQNKRDAAFKQLKMQNKAIIQFEKRIFKTEPDENLEDQFNVQLENAKLISNLNAKLIDDCKTSLKLQLSKMKK